jgi:hypothetical protein
MDYIVCLREGYAISQVELHFDLSSFQNIKPKQQLQKLVRSAEIFAVICNQTAITKSQF